MNGRSQIQEGKNWILLKEVKANRFFCDSYWLGIWKNHVCPSMGLNEGSLAIDSARLGLRCLCTNKISLLHLSRTVKSFVFSLHN
jgi:hypothetical protein